MRRLILRKMRTLIDSIARLVEMFKRITKENTFSGLLIVQGVVFPSHTEVVESLLRGCLNLDFLF
jgi:hypothetical protein